MPMDEVPSSSSASESDAVERPKAAAANLLEVEIAAPLVAHVNSIAAKYRKGKYKRDIKLFGMGNSNGLK